MVILFILTDWGAVALRPPRYYQERLHLACLQYDTDSLFEATAALRDAG